MQIFLDCLPCMLRQVLEASRMATKELAVQELIMEDALKIAANYKRFTCSPAMCRAMHQIVRRETGVEDTYAKIKAKDIKAAEDVYPFLLEFLRQKDDLLSWAFKIAATGNSLDSAIRITPDVKKCTAEELGKDFAICDIEDFQKLAYSAKTVLIIGDNAGETIFDKVLLRRLAGFELTYAARGGPIINDATVADAYASGLGDYARIISTGCGAPGAVLEDCSAEFVECFNTADIVISKGQGNFEALSEQKREIFFLLKAKCPMIANRLGVDLNAYVFRYSNMDQGKGIKN